MNPAYYLRSNYLHRISENTWFTFCPLALTFTHQLALFSHLLYSPLSFFITVSVSFTWCSLCSSDVGFTPCKHMGDDNIIEGDENSFWQPVTKWDVSRLKTVYCVNQHHSCKISSPLGSQRNHTFNVQSSLFNMRKSLSVRGEVAQMHKVLNCSFERTRLDVAGQQVKNVDCTCCSGFILNIHPTPGYAG